MQHTKLREEKDPMTRRDEMSDEMSDFLEDENENVSASPEVCNTSHDNSH